MMGDPQESIAAFWDGHQFTIDREHIPFQGRPMIVNGGLYLLSKELSVNYEMIAEGERGTIRYAEKYRKL